MVDDVLSGNPDKAESYRGGKRALLGFFVRQVVRASQGTADPKVVKKVFVDRLG